jgi:hypothetical protein
MKRIHLLVISLLLAFVAQAAEYTPVTLPNPKAQDHSSYVANPDHIIASEEVLFPIYAVIGVIAILALAFTSIHEEPVAKGSSFAQCFKLLGNPFILLCFLGIMCHVGIDVGTNTTAPKTLMERLGEPTVPGKLIAEDPEKTRRICRELIARYELDMLILTCGAIGSYVFTDSKESYVATPKVQLADTVGAGDSFTATFVAQLLLGKTIREAHEKAVAVSAYVCTQRGAMPLLPRHVRSARSS